MKNPVTSEDITNRFIELIYNGTIKLEDQVKTFNELSEIFGLKTMSNQARQENKSPAAISQSKRIFILIDNVKFYFNND
jgi:hypothetical protein